MYLLALARDERHLLYKKEIDVMGEENMDKLDMKGEKS